MAFRCLTRVTEKMAFSAGSKTAEKATSLSYAHLLRYSLRSESYIGCRLRFLRIAVVRQTLHPDYAMDFTPRLSFTSGPP